jgi:putative membrane protein
MAEVQLGQLAAQKATNADVKAFAEQMVRDHSKSNEDLKQLAAKKGITLPTTITDEKKAEIEKLEKLSGPAFEREYLAIMVRDHSKNVTAFQDRSANAADSDLKAFATGLLPTLQEHLRMAKEIQAKLK